MSNLLNCMAIESILCYCVDPTGRLSSFFCLPSIFIGTFISAWPDIVLNFKHWHNGNPQMHTLCLMTHAIFNCVAVSTINLLKLFKLSPFISWFILYVYSLQFTCYATCHIPRNSCIYP